MLYLGKILYKIMYVSITPLFLRYNLSFEKFPEVYNFETYKTGLSYLKLCLVKS